MAGKVEQPAEQIGVLGDRIEHLDRRRAERRDADPRQIDVGVRRRQIAFDPLAPAPDRLGDLLGCGSAVGGVELDAEVAVGAARVVARREDDRAEGGARAHDAARRRSRQDAGAADQDAAEAVRRRHANDRLDRDVVVEAAVAADDERAGDEAGQ